MDKQNISLIRLYNQKIALTKLNSAKEVVGWMGAIQAQDYNMAKLAVAIRTGGLKEEAVQSAVDSGEIIRTHAMRPTWHFIASQDIYWILDLTAPRIISSMKSRDKQLGLNEKVYKKCLTVIEKSFKRSSFLSRDEITAELEKASIDTGENRAAHILMRAELSKLICSGKSINNKQTYSLLSERVPAEKTLTKEESLGLLAEKYFQSHSPATLRDFAWWSGLSVSDSRKAVDLIKPGFHIETIDTENYILNSSTEIKLKQDDDLYLLPAFDEFIISYKDRSVYLTFDKHRKSVSNNGIFRPVIVAGGKVTGTWKRIIKKDTVTFETEFFRKHDKIELKKLNSAFEKIAALLNKSYEIRKN